MKKEGHIGLALMLCSPFFLFFNFNIDINYLLGTCLITAGLSFVPDIDLLFAIDHRGLTHTFLFGLMFSSIVSLCLGLLVEQKIGWVIGFVAGFGAITSHLLGDVLTHMPIKPFYPLSKKEFAFAFFPASSKKANSTFIITGIIVVIFLIVLTSFQG